MQVQRGVLCPLFSQRTHECCYCCRGSGHTAEIGRGRARRYCVSDQTTQSTPRNGPIVRITCCSPRLTSECTHALPPTERRGEVAVGLGISGCYIRKTATAPGRWSSSRSRFVTASESCDPDPVSPSALTRSPCPFPQHFLERDPERWCQVSETSSFRGNSNYDRVERTTVATELGKWNSLDIFLTHFGEIH